MRATRGGLGLAAVGIVALTGFAPGADAAVRRANLSVTAVGSVPAIAVAGERAAFSGTVRNGGRIAAPASKAAVLLSSDRTRGRGDVALGRLSVTRLARGKSATARGKLRIPAQTAAARYFVLVCADAAAGVRETSERDNCRASKTRVRVTRVGDVPVAGSTVIPPFGKPPFVAAPLAAPPSGPVAFPQPANPLAVGFTTQTSRATSMLVDPRFGGESLFATAQDGTKYQLTIPGSGLASATKITMTPLNGLTGLPGGATLRGGVQLEPEGLQLTGVATLKITPPAASPVPLDRQAAFASTGSGGDFHLAPLQVASAAATPTVLLTHFSTAGLLDAGPADRAAVLAQTPAGDRAQLEQANAELARERRLSTEQSQALADTWAANFAAYHDGVLNPLIAKGMSSDDAAAQALAEIFSWMRSIQLVPLETHPLLQAKFDAMTARVTDLVRAGIDRNYAQCVGHDLTAVQRILRYARLSALLGLGLDEDSADLVTACAKFRFTYDGAQVTEGSGTMGEDRNPIVGTGKLRLGIDASIGLRLWDTKVPVTWKETTSTTLQTYASCNPPPGDSTQRISYSAPINGTISLFVDMDVNVFQGAPPPTLATSALRVRFWQEVPGISLTRTIQNNYCSGPVSTPTSLPIWPPPGVGFNVDSAGITGWTAGTGAVLATKSFATLPPGPGHGIGIDTFTAKLEHTPS